ncbi:MAG: hypothetical protein B7Y88_14250 [Sphingomonadales bacterium 32-64-17]|nr:MAG: hypothetical protein B7Y88_14250 [Sphingomonadales bacterium 32-64-17]
MTVAEKSRYRDYAENGVTTSWALPWRFDDAADIRAQRTAADGTATQLELNIDYTVTGGETDDGGTLTTAAAAATGTQLNVWSETSRGQTADYDTNDRFPAETHERRLDVLAMVAQEQDREIDRGVKVPRGEASFEFPAAATRVGKFQAFDAAGNPIMSSGTGADAGLRDDLAAPTGSRLAGFNPELRHSSGTAAWYLNGISDRYVNVASICNNIADTEDVFAAVQAAFVAGQNREIVFTHPYGGTRQYRFLNRASGRLFMPQKGRIICETGAELDFSAYGDSTSGTPYLYAEGTVGTEYLLASDAGSGDFEVELEAGAGANFAAGDDIFIRSAAAFTTQDDALGTAGEWAFVGSVAGDTLTLVTPLRGIYTAIAAAYVTKVDPVSIDMEGVSIRGAGRFSTDNLGDRGIQIINAKNCNIGITLIDRCDFNGVVLHNALNSKVYGGGTIKFDPKGAVNGQNQYGVTFVNMCENTWAKDIGVIGGKEAFCLSVSGQPQGVSRDVGFDNCNVRGAWRSAFASHDNHEAWTVKGCKAWDCEQGVDNRCKKFTLSHSQFYRMGAFEGNLDCAVQIGSGAGEMHGSNNYIEDVLRGYWMPSAIAHESVPGDITSKNDVMRKVRARGVLLDYRTTATDPGGTANPTGPLGTAHVEGLDIECDASVAGRAVEMHGRWTAPVVSGGIFKGGNGTTACVYLHATNNGGGTGGPSDPNVIGLKYGAGYLAPSIQHATGVTKNTGHTTIGV